MMNCFDLGVCGRWKRKQIQIYDTGGEQLPGISGRIYFEIEVVWLVCPFFCLVKNNTNENPRFCAVYIPYSTAHMHTLELLTDTPHNAYNHG
jgi:hypothetical protein